jgi:Domain of unknown function (DUF397)
MVNSGEHASPGRASSVGLSTVDASRTTHFSATEIAVAAWHKSSWSSFNGSCVEVAELQGNRVCVRDTKAAGAGPILVFAHAEWNSLLTKIKSGELDFG